MAIRRLLLRAGRPGRGPAPRRPHGPCGGTTSESPCRRRRARRRLARGRDRAGRDVVSGSPSSWADIAPRRNRWRLGCGWGGGDDGLTTRQGGSRGSSSRSGSRRAAQVTLADDFDPRYQDGIAGKATAAPSSRRGSRSFRPPGPPPAQSAWGCSSSSRRSTPPARTGRSASDERGESAGREGLELQGALDRGARPRLPLAVPQKLPARGEIGIFNRSHYEEVLVVRVHPENLDRKSCRRPRKGRRLEAPLPRDQRLGALPSDNGIKIVKLFLNLSKDEQRARFLKRIEVPEKNWKFSPADVAERARWDDSSTRSRRCSPTRAPSGRLGT